MPVQPRTSYLSLLPVELRTEIAAYLPTIKDQVRFAKLTVRQNSPRPGAVRGDTIAFAELGPLTTHALSDPTLMQLLIREHDGAAPSDAASVHALHQLNDPDTRARLRMLLADVPEGSSHVAGVEHMLRDYQSMVDRPYLCSQYLSPEGWEVVRHRPGARLALAQDAYVAQHTLSRLARSATDPAERAALLAHPEIGLREIFPLVETAFIPMFASPLADLAKDCRSNTEFHAILSHPHMGNLALATLYPHAQTHGERLKVLRHPACVDSTFQYILRHKTLAHETSSPAEIAELRHEIIEHTYAGPMTLFLLARDATSAAERWAIRQHCNASVKVSDYPRVSFVGNRIRGHAHAITILAESAYDPIERFALRTHPATDGDTLASLAETAYDPDERLALLRHPAADVGTLASLAATAESAIERAAILEHPLVDSKVLKIIASRTLDKHERAAILNHPEMSLSVATALAENIVHLTELKRIMAVKFASDFTLARIARRTVTRQERLQVLRHPKASSQTLSELAKTSIERTERDELAKHPKSRMQVMEALFRRETDPHRRNVQRARLGPELVVRIEATANENTRRIRLAQSTQTAIRTLHALARAPKSALERINLLRNPHADAIVISRLARKVQYPSERIAIARHPATGPYTLEALAKESQFPEERLALARHRNSNLATLRRLRVTDLQFTDRIHVERRIAKLSADALSGREPASP